MASRHDIINITFQANAGKANVALQTLQEEAKKSSDRVKDLKQQLDQGLRANLPADQIQKIRDDIKLAEKDVRQWEGAYRDLTKGVRTLDEAIKQFNAGTLNQMSASFNKAAANAAKLAQSKMTPGTLEWKEMDALIVEAQSNILKATADINGLVDAIKKGGTSSKSTLAQAKNDLEQLLTLEVRGSDEWKNYDKQLKVVVGELNKLAEAERKATQADQLSAMNKRMKSLKTESSSGLAEMKRFWQTMVAGAEQGSAELAKYEERLKKVIAQERSRVAAGAQQTLVSPEKYGIDQVRAAVQEMTKLRDGLQQGIPLWNKYNTLIKQGEAYLAEYAENEKIARGEALSLNDALKVANAAGGKGFAGTAQQLQQAEAALQKAAAAAKKGSPEWIKYQEALAKVRVEMNNAAMTSERMHEILDKPTNAKNLNELSAAVKRAKAELDLMAGTVGKNSKEYATLASKTKDAEIQLKELQAQAKGTSTAFDKAWSRLKTYIGLYMGAAVAIQKLTATLGDLMELSDKMGEVRKTTGFTAEEVGHLSNELKKLDTRTTITGLLDLSVAAGQLGLKTQEDVEGFTIAANKLMVALPEMGKEGATEMLKVALATGEIDKIRRQMEEGLIEGSSATAVAMEKVGSTIDRLRATSAATAPAITDFVKRVGAVGAQSGISIDQVAALGSTVDALGMRVEMSATALSRMVPAIKNNAFAIGQVIGKTEEYIRKQFSEGHGMEVILDVFDAIKNSGKTSADDIEAMFGGSMQEIMKELNQQGARAGIVFAGLSQNVDELRRQLGIASKAYEENIAIQQEYNKMNETTAAKWERLKNEVEEMFVGDDAQRWLGNIIDGLRGLVNLITGNVKPALQWLSVTIKTIIVTWAAFKVGLGEGLIYKLTASIKSLGQSISQMGTHIKDYLVYQWQLIRAKDEEAKATIRATMAQKGLNKEMIANVWMAVATAIIYVTYKLYEYYKAAKEAAAETGKFNQKVYEEQQALNNLFNPLNKSNLAQEERSKLISEINSKYGKYLGYMLSETTSAVQLADAHALIAKRIREEAYERRIAEQERKVQEEHANDVNSAYAKITERLRGGARGDVDVQAMADMLKGIVDSRVGEIKYAISSSSLFGGSKGYMLDPNIKSAIDNGIERLVVDGKLSRDNVGLIQKAVYDYTVEAKGQHDDIMMQTSNMRSDLRGIQGAIQTDLTNNLSRLVGNISKLATNSQQSTQNTGPLAPQPYSLPVFGQESGGFGMFNFGQQKSQVNVPLPSEKPKINEKNTEQVREYVKAQDNLRSWLNQYSQTISKSDREAAEAWLDSEKEVERLRKIVTKADANNPNNPNRNPYGNFTVMDSYDKWSADALVDRKKQMLQYVRAMANGADVQAILSQDKKFMDDATRKGIKNVRDAIEWYNTERLKIQEELADRHLTNEGGWANPAKSKSRRPRQPMSESAIAQLEEYYAWRKEEVERQRTEEGISEAEFNRRIEALEQEHLQKRSDLRKSFTSQDKKYVEQFRQWWASVRELDEVEWDLIDAEWKVAIKRDRDYNDMKAAKDLSAMKAIVVKQLKAIEDIIAKERPFNGITDNLEANLTTMGILFADLDKMKAKALAEGSDTSAIDALYGTDRAKRISFILGESENAFSSSIEDIMQRMADAGMTAWADEIRKSPKMQEALIAQLHSTYDAIQDAIKREASLMKKQAENMWNSILLPGGDGKTTIKDFFEKTVSQLGIEQGRVSRANSLVGAGRASEQVADKLAIKQMQIQLTMQQHYYNLMRKQGMQRIKDLERAVELAKEEQDIEKAKRLEQDKQHVEMSLRLAMTKEQTDLLKQQEEIIARTEESQNRLYSELKEWADLFANSTREVMEASNAGSSEYYNERAKLNLTGKGGPGAGTYIVIENEGTEDAKAHYEYLDERQALERQYEIEQQNAQAEAWKNVMDDISMKLNDTITDQLNAMMQNAAIDMNTDATRLNTEALQQLTASMQGKNGVDMPNLLGGESGMSGTSESGTSGLQPLTPDEVQEWTNALSTEPWQVWADASTAATQTVLANQKDAQQGQLQTDQKMVSSTQSMFAKMTAAANLYGIAYQAMSNENLSTSQKVQLMAVQAAGQAAISSLTATIAETSAETTARTPSVFAWLWSKLGFGAIPVFALFTGGLGALMALATSAITKSKSQISQVTGASASAGRLSTGMLTYAEGNVNEFTDPSSLTPGRSYNVDAADGRTYRARYMGKNAKTHITSGPEFHLVGERGQEAIIDAHTTRNIRMNEPELWKNIQTLYNGGRLSSVSRRGRGMRAFASGNLDDFEEVESTMNTDTAMGFSSDMAASLQASLDRNSDVLERAITQGIKGVFDVYGKGGLIDSYDSGKKNVSRHGERY